MNVDLGPSDAAVQARIRVFAEEGQTYLIEPKFIIKDELLSRPLELNQEIATRLTLDDIDPNTGSVKITFETSQKDWIIIQAVEKPQINVLWIGTIVMIIGFIIATRRRYVEFVKMRDKGFA